MATTQQDPTQAAFSDAAQVPDVPKSTGERVMSVVGGLTGRSKGSPLDQAIEKHHQARLDEAKMHRRNAATAAGILTYGIDPKTGQPLTDEQKQQYQNEYQAAMGHYEKIAGVNKETKGAIQKARMLVEHMIGQGQKKQAGAQGAPGTPPPPPAPGQQPAAPSPASSAPPAGPAGGPPPPVPFADAAPFLRDQLAETKQIEGAKRVEQAMVTQRQDFAKQLGMDPAQLTTQEYILTGKIPASATSQHKFQKGPMMEDANGVPHETVFDPASGDILDERTHDKVSDEWRPLSAADLATRTINVMKPDGKPEIMFRKGNKVYNNKGELQEGELMPFQRGMLPTTSDREVMGFDENGMPTKYMLRTTRKVGMGGSATAGGPPAPPSASGGSTAKPASAQGGGKSPKLVIPAAQYSQFNKTATATDEARNSLIGDEPDQVGGLAADLHIFKNPDSVKRIGEYLELVDNQIANEAKAVVGQGPLAAAEWYLRLPQTIIGLQQGALRDSSKGLSPDEQRFVADYFRTMGTIGGLRMATGASSAKWSYNVLRSEMPTPGIVTNYNEAQRRLLNYVKETNIVSKRNPLSKKVDTTKVEDKLRGGGPPEPGGTVHFVEGADHWDIPADKVARFTKAHPNAKRQ